MMEQNIPPQPILVGEQPTLPKPSAVSTGTRLLYASLLLWIVTGFITIPGIVHKTPTISPVLLVGLSLINVYLTLPKIEQSTFTGISMVVQTVLMAAGLLLLVFARFLCVVQERSLTRTTS